MTEQIETPNFASTAQLVAWMKFAKTMARYQRVASHVTTVFADGHSTTHEIKRNAKTKEKPGTIAANFSFMIKTLVGEMDHTGDPILGAEIDRRGGVMFIYTLQ